MAGGPQAFPHALGTQVAAAGKILAWGSGAGPPIPAVWRFIGQWNHTWRSAESPPPPPQSITCGRAGMLQPISPFHRGAVGDRGGVPPMHFDSRTKLRGRSNLAWPISGVHRTYVPGEYLLRFCSTLALDLVKTPPNNWKATDGKELPPKKTRKEALRNTTHLSIAYRLN